MQDYPKLDKFKDALKQAAQTITSIKVVFADATVNSGALAAFPLLLILLLIWHLHTPYDLQPSILSNRSLCCLHGSHRVALGAHSMRWQVWKALQDDVTGSTIL